MKIGLSRRFHGRDGTESIVPLIVSGRFSGHTLHATTHHEAGFSAEDETILQQIATLVGASIENRQLLTAAQQRARREQILREITAQVRSSADIETIMRTAVAEVGRALGRQTIIQLNDASSIVRNGVQEGQDGA
jgi:GAF domain-containing protein